MYKSLNPSASFFTKTQNIRFLFTKKKMGFNFISLLFLPLLSVTILSGLEQALASDNTLLKNTNHRNSTADGGMSSLRGKKQRSGCNLFQGRWVFDASYPFYDSFSCPFIDGEFDCLKFGRPDKQFLKYSWQPESCTIPRFLFNYSLICPTFLTKQ